MLKAVLALASRGLRLFPLAPGSKLPLISRDAGGRGCLDATSDAETVAAYWDAFPDANVGLAAGEGLVVLDVDPKTGGPASLAALEAEHGDLPETLAARTPSGGFHLYFRTAAKVKNSASKVAPGLDVRSDGGYVVAPPSSTPAGAYAWLDEREPAEIPTWLVDLLTKGIESAAIRVGYEPPATPVPLDLGPLRQAVADARYRYARGKTQGDAEKREVLDRVLEGRALAGEGQRDHTVNRACAILAFLPGWGDAPLDAAQEILRPSVSLMANDPPEEYARWMSHWVEKIADRFPHHQETRRAADAERDAKAAAFRDRIRATMGGSDVSRVSSEDVGGDQDPSGRADSPGDLVPGGDADGTRSRLAELLGRPVTDPDWSAHLLWTDDGALKQCGANVDGVLRHAPSVKGTVRWNDFAKTVEVVGGPWAHVHPSVLDVAVGNWLQREIGLTADLGTVGRQLLAVARETPYDPLAEWLGGLEWDGVERCDDFLADYFSARAEDDLGRDLTEYLRAVGPRWLVSCVARAMSPGCKVDTVLVLEGRQGIKKSSAFEVLAHPFFTDTPIVIGDKDGRMLAARSWIVELAELASIRRSDVEATRAFITSKVDTFRPPYGRVVEDFPRRCVFVGTTNEDDYLHDTAGNRRFWPVAVGGQIDLERVARDREMIWAEAVARYRAGEPWWLDAEGEAVAAGVASERAGETTARERVADWWYALERRPEYVRAHEVAEQVLKLTTDRITNPIVGQVAAALRQLGFSARRKLVGNTFCRVHVPTETMRSAPRAGRAGGHLASIAAAVANKGTGT